MIYGLLFLPFALVALAILANLRRRGRPFDYELTPNCLLTRWPVLFVTGRRSLFYFHKYWNVYPEFLAEHGYEVFTLHLPWSGGTERARRLEEFLEEHSRQGRHYHLVTDLPSRKEFDSLWKKNYPCVASLTTPEPASLQNSPLHPLDSLTYRLHRWQNGTEATADPHSLGISPAASLRNAHLLLQQIAQRAEEDLQSSEV